MANSTRKHVLRFCGAALAIAAGSAAPASAQLVCGGATSVQAAVDAKFLAPGCDTYAPSGSGAGRTGFSNGSLDVASSDATKVEGAVNVNALNVPVSIVTNAKITVTTAQICASLESAIKNGVAPKTSDGRAVLTAFRSDSSGTTAILNSFLATACASAVQIPNPATTAPAGGVLAAGSAGVIDAIKNAPKDVLAIGAVDSAVALKAEGIHIAVRDLTSGPNYLVFATTPKDPAKAAAQKALCQAVVSAERQALALPLGYLAGADAAKPEVCDAIQVP
jgi:ABC-type phosphate transport system substrate-binding protein